MVHSEHILWDKAELGWKRQWQRRLLYRMAACVFTVSQGQLQQMLDTGHRHRWQFCLPNGVDPARFHPPTESKPSLKQRLNLDPTSFWFGNVARFGTTKRHMDLIAAFELAVEHDPRLGLLLVGDGGSEKKAVLARIKASPARHRIHWAGFQQNPVIWYQAMDALVVASSFEGLPNSVLEGMACGIPILANDVCGVREILHHGKHGWVEDLSNVEKLTTALLRNAQTPAATLAEMGMDACAHARQEHSLSAMVAKYALMYAAVAADTPTDLDVQATSFSL